MKRFLILLLLVAGFYSCNNTSSQENNTEVEGFYENENSDTYADNSYCAEVEYYNSKTGTNSTYTLTVDVENNEVVRINFPQGWLDSSDFNSVELDMYGECEVEDYDGRQYKIKIIGEASGCYEDVPRAEQCQGVTEDGYQCERLTDNLSGFCWQHEDQE